MTRQWVTPVHVWKVAQMGGDGTDTGDVDMNEEVRDRFEMLSDHVHAGSDGEGSADIVPDSVQFTDQSDLAAPGAGKTVVWSNGGRLKQRAGAGGSVEIIQEAHASHTAATT